MQVTLKNFTRTELLSSGGTVFVLPPHLEQNLERLAIALQALRNWWGKPIRITSGYRSAEHNALIGGAPNSLHVSALAADVYSDYFDDFKVFCGKYWPGGVILYATHIHLDLGSYYRGRK